MKFFVTICFIVFFCVGSILAQWEYWVADELPNATADTAWHYEQEEDGGTITYSTIIDDPDIPGNKLLQFSETEGAPQETFFNNWNADPGIGATLVFRMKALEVGTYNRDWDIYLYNGYVRQRLVSNNGTEIKFDKEPKAAVDFNTSDWHTYRLTILEDQIELFIDEDVLSYLITTGETNEGNLFRFGDLGSSTIGTLYDWIAWNINGAYPPGEGDPLPAVLTGITAVEKISSLTPDKFDLNQNFPNPFNPTTEITFEVQKASNIEINVYNLNGQLIRNLVNENKNSGAYSVKWNGTDNDGRAVSSGIYIYTMKADNFSTSKKMTLIK